MCLLLLLLCLLLLCLLLLCLLLLCLLLFIIVLLCIIIILIVVVVVRCNRFWLTMVLFVMYLWDVIGGFYCYGSVLSAMLVLLVLLLITPLVSPLPMTILAAIVIVSGNTWKSIVYLSMSMSMSMFLFLYWSLFCVLVFLFVLLFGYSCVGPYIVTVYGILLSGGPSRLQTSKTSMECKQKRLNHVTCCFYLHFSSRHSSG